MKRKIIIIAVLSLLFMLVSSVRIKNDLAFDFSLTYNVNGNDRISTFDNTFRVDTVEGVKEIHLVLSDEDMVLIQNKIIETSILNEEVKLKKYMSVEPCGLYNLYILMDNRKYSFSWTTNNMVPFAIDPTNEGIVINDEY